jgi:hypothetical protein
MKGMLTMQEGKSVLVLAHDSIDIRVMVAYILGRVGRTLAFR